MQLTPEQVAYIVDRIAELWGPRPCEACGADDWSLSTSVCVLSSYLPAQDVPEESPVVPVIPVTCSKCGNTRLVNAIAIGVMEKQLDEVMSKSRDARETRHE